MIAMKNKPKDARHHEWDVTPSRAREIQETLRKRWTGEDLLPRMRLVAGLDASFVLVASQALTLKKRPNRWGVLRDANRAIGCVVTYRYPEMEEVERAYAVLPLEFPFIPGLLSFREIPVLLTALAKLKQMPDLLYCDGQGYAHRGDLELPVTWECCWTGRRSGAPRVCWLRRTARWVKRPEAGRRWWMRRPEENASARSCERGTRCGRFTFPKAIG